MVQNISEINETGVCLYNISLTHNDDLHSLHGEMLLGPMIFIGCLIVIGIPGNLLVLVVYGRKDTPSVNRTIIITLAIYDLLVSSITLPFEFYDQYVRFRFPEHAEMACKIFRTMNYFLVFNSSSVIQLMTIERFKRVCRPLKRQMTPRVALMGIIIIFGICLVVTIPNIFIRGFQKKYFENNLTGNDCAVSDDFVNSNFLVYYNGGLLITCVCNIFCVIIQYIFIGRQIYKHFQFVKNQTPKYNKQLYESSRSTCFSQTDTGVRLDNKTVTSDSTENIQGERTIADSTKSDRTSYKSTKIAIMISIFFILSYVPTLLDSVLESILGKSRINQFVSPSVKNIIEKTFAVNHVVNPFIYGFIDEKFRQDCKEVLNVILKRR